MYACSNRKVAGLILTDTYSQGVQLDQHASTKRSPV